MEALKAGVGQTGEETKQEWPILGKVKTRLSACNAVGHAWEGSGFGRSGVFQPPSRVRSAFMGQSRHARDRDGASLS